MPAKFLKKLAMIFKAYDYVLKKQKNALKLYRKNTKQNIKILKKYKKLIEILTSDRNLLLLKIEDIFRRFNVAVIGKVGEKFDPKTMRVIALSAGHHDLESGMVSRICRYGYIRDQKILSLAEVEVKK